MSANRFSEALADLKKAREIDPRNAKVLHRLARVYVSLGQPSEAVDVLKQISSFQPVTASERAAAATMQAHIDQADDGIQRGTTGSMVIHALDQAERGLGVGVEKPRKWQLMRGEAYLKMGNVNSLGDAQGVAMSLLRKNSKDPEALVLRGRVLYAQGENDKALQHFREALSCDPDYKDGVKYLRLVQKLERMKEEGNKAYKTGKYRQAVEVYGQALEVDSANKGINSKLHQNRALASIKVYSPFPINRIGTTRESDFLTLPLLHSSRTTNPPSPTVTALSPSTPATSKPAKPAPAPSANPAPGKTQCANTRPSMNPTRRNRASKGTSITPNWSSRNRNAKITTSSLEWRRMRRKTTSRRRTAS